MSVEQDLYNLLTRHGVQVYRGGENKHVRHGWIGFSCPMCGDNGDAHMGVNLQFLYASCWLCGKHKLYDVMKAMDAGIPWGEVKEIQAKLDLVPTAFDNKKRGRYKPPDDLIPLTPRHESYLQGRGIETDSDWFPKYGVKSVGMNGGRYKYRVFLPVTLGQKEVSYTTRSTLSHGLRYLSASPEDEAVSHKELLFGEDFVRSVIVVHEGPLDALRVGPGAVATFGTAYSKAQLYRIGRYPKRYICFDTEPGAQARAEKLADDLSVLPGKTWNVQLDAKDAGASSPREVARLRRLIDG